LSGKAPLTARAFGFLLELAEQEPPVVTARILDEELGAQGASLIDGCLLLPGKPMKSIHVVLADGYTQAFVDFDHTTGTSRYFHPEVGFVDVAAGQLRAWRLDTATFVRLICRMLGLPPSRSPIPLVNGVLWDLGTPRLGRRTGIPVLFARRLVTADVRAGLRPELELRLGNQPALLMTSSRWVPGDVLLPGISRIVPVARVMQRCKALAELDIERLAAFADPRPGLEARAALPVECTEDGSWLRIREQEYTFRGRKKRLIRLLYEAWARGDPWVGVKWLLAEAEYDSKRIEDVFRDGRASKRNQWKQFIEVNGGMCRLRIDP
jgi:hypothetical protein